MAEEGAYGSANMDEKNLLDYCRVVWKRRGLIMALFVGSILISAVYSLTLPKLYRATATILSPSETGIGGGSQISMSLGSGVRTGARGIDLLDSLMSSSGGLFSLNPTTPTRDTYLALLRSRTLNEEVIEHFKKTWGPSVGSLIKGVKISKDKKGPIAVTVVSLDPKIAAAFANYYFTNLSSMLSRRAKLTAEKQTEFYERQLDRTKLELKKAQQALIKFQEENRFIALDPVTKSVIAMGAMQAGSVMTLEMERNLKRNYLTEEHPEMIALNRRIYEAKKLVSHQLYGEPQSLPPESPGAPFRKEFFVAKTKMTPLQFKLAQVYRQLRFRQSIENSIHQNLESLKYTIENPPSIYIDWLDRALSPGGPFKPVIRRNLIAAAVGSLVFGVLLVFFLEYIERIKALEQRRQQKVNSQ